MTTLSPEEKFAELFEGRDDAYGLVHGQSVKGTVVQALYDHHLHEEGWSIGIYPMVQVPTVLPDAHRWGVKWGCSDVDDGFEKSLPLAINLWKVLNHLGITSWIERTKGKGYHVWVFVTDWVEAEAMRNCLLFAHQIAGVTATEVNPKQTKLADDKLGNYVNLPYAKDWYDTCKRVVLDHENNRVYTDFDKWVDLAHEQRVHPNQIRLVGEMYVPPPPPKPVRIVRPLVDRSSLSDKLDGLGYAIYKDGPLERGGKIDRSTALQRLAHLMAERTDLTAGEACDLLYDADQRWGKFHEQGRTDYLDKMIRKAYG